jgi:hypothetical protein
MLQFFLVAYLGITAKRRDLRTTHPVTERLKEEEEKSSIQNV